MGACGGVSAGQLLQSLQLHFPGLQRSSARGSTSCEARPRGTGAAPFRRGAGAGRCSGA